MADRFLIILTILIFFFEIHPIRKIAASTMILMLTITHVRKPVLVYMTLSDFNSLIKCFIGICLIVIINLTWVNWVLVKIKNLREF